jgi:hypothetical protein
MTEKKRKFSKQKKNMYTNEDNNFRDNDMKQNKFSFEGLETHTDDLENEKHRFNRRRQSSRLMQKWILKKSSYVP